MPELRTRQDVIWGHVRLAMQHCGAITRESFAQDVVDLYWARTPKPLRGIKFHECERGDEVYVIQRKNAQLLFRMIDRDNPDPSRMPHEIEEAVVLALPDLYRAECLRDLAARYGLMAAPLPAVDAPARMVSAGEFTGEFGECLKALAATIGDGDLTRADAARAPAVVTSLDALIAQATSLRAAHLRVCGGPVPAERAGGSRA